MKWASLALIISFFSLGGYETWALSTNNITISRLFWDVELGNYGLLLPGLLGLLAGHFVIVSIDTILAFFYLFVFSGLFWHITNSIGVRKP